MLDLVAYLIVISLAVLIPRFAEPIWRRVKRPYRWLARRQCSAVLAVFVASLLANVIFAMIVGWPLPSVHDEFAYLLGADTFAHGRLTNPPHPFWEHFESFHLLMQPTYQMKYPPGQSLVLALGQCLGDPAIGLWLSLAAASAGVCWMLQGWMPARWALLGGLLCAWHAGLIRYWGNGYMGGAVAMLGGALLFGAVPRLCRKPSIGTALALASGLAILANSRPYEGLLASLTAFGFSTFAWLSRTSRQPSSLAPSSKEPINFAWSAIIAASTLLVVVAAWMLHYNQQVTGDPFRLPYQVWQATYSEKSLLHIEMPLSDEEVVNKRRLPLPDESFATFREPDSWSQKLFRLTIYFARPYMLLPFAIAFLRPRRASERMAVIAFVIVMLAILGQDTGGYPHYMAPVTGLIFLLVTQGLRRMSVSRWPRPGSGRLIVRMTLPLAVFVVGMSIAEWRKLDRRPSFARSRQKVIARLEAIPGKHLVFVQYRPTHSAYDEWVYNLADIDASRIIWARELTPPQNRELRSYYSDRHIWNLDADRHPIRLRRRPPAT